jgi:transposase-like protein
MGVAKELDNQSILTSERKKKRHFLTPEKKLQIFLESIRGKTPVGEILRREGIYSTDLVRIRQKAQEGALERLADRPGAKKKMIARDDYEALKRELQDKERVLAELALELAILRKKTNGGSWDR